MLTSLKIQWCSKTMQLRCPKKTIFIANSQKPNFAKYTKGKISQDFSVSYNSFGAKFFGTIKIKLFVPIFTTFFAVFLNFFSMFVLPQIHFTQSYK